MLKSLQRCARDEQGTLVLELTFLVPVLLILAFGAIEFGAVFLSHQAISQQVHEATRYLARTNTPTATDIAFMLATSKHPDTPCPSGGNSNACIFPWFSPSNLSAAVTEIDNPEDANGFRLYRGGETIPVVTVTATATYPGMNMLSSAIVGITNPIVLTITHSERVIGQ
jgi:Flp pilus assembly protein TadG